MSDRDIELIFGCVLVLLFCSWAVFSLLGRFRENVATGTAIDATLSEVKRDKAPGMFLVQVIGFLALIGTSAVIGLGALVKLIQVLIGLL